MLRDPNTITTLRVPCFKPMELLVEASPRRIFANAHTYHINSISVNSDQETYLSADDLRINLWHLEVTNQSFSILLLVMTVHCSFQNLRLLVMLSPCFYHWHFLCVSMYRTDNLHTSIRTSGQSI